MQLDRTEIVIRQRTALELFDLSLLVYKRYFKSILLTSALVGLPLLTLDVFAVQWMMGEDAAMVAEDMPIPILSMRSRHTAHLVLLFVMQFPLMSLPATIFLGHQIFFEPFSLSELWKRLAPIALFSLVVLGIMRLGLVSLVIELFVNRGVVFDAVTEIWLLFVIPSLALLLRACYPFAPEILGLERCGMRAKAAGEISYASRNRSLHSQLVGENLVRFAASFIFGILLVLMLVGGALFVQGTLFADWQWNRWFDHVWLPLALWLVGSFFVVFRFLSYLDCRIRLEGWEIELSVRAEAERLSQIQSVALANPEAPRERVAP